MKHDLEYTDREKMDAELKKISKKIDIFAFLTKISAIALGFTGVLSIVAVCGLLSTGAAIGSYIFAGAALTGFLSCFGVGVALSTKEEKLERKINNIILQEELEKEDIKLKENVKLASLEDENDFKPEITIKEKPEIQKQKFEPETDEDVRGIGDGL